MPGGIWSGVENRPADLGSPRCSGSQAVHPAAPSAVAVAEVWNGKAWKVTAPIAWPKGATNPSPNSLSCATAMDKAARGRSAGPAPLRARPWHAVEEATNELAALRFAIRRHLAYSRDPSAARRAARSIGYAAGELDRMLPGALADLIADRELVLAPTGALHALPWPCWPAGGNGR